MNLGLALRFGWNIQEGVGAFPAPPGRGFFQSYQIPKPASASPHGIEIVLGTRGESLIYSVIYDGSILTNDGRDVERDNFLAAVGFGVNYHYYDFFSLRFALQKSTKLLDEESLPDPLPGEDKTSADTSFGSVIIDFYF